MSEHTAITAFFRGERVVVWSKGSLSENRMCRGRKTTNQGRPAAALRGALKWPERTKAYLIFTIIKKNNLKKYKKMASPKRPSHAKNLKITRAIHIIELILEILQRFQAVEKHGPKKCTTVHVMEIINGIYPLTTVPRPRE